MCPNAGACKDLCYAINEVILPATHRDRDRHADVFPTTEDIVEAGYMDQSESDLYAILLPSNKIGIPANNIRHFKKRQGTNTFGQIEAGKIRHGRGTE